MPSIRRRRPRPLTLLLFLLVVFLAIVGSSSTSPETSFQRHSRSNVEPARLAPFSSSIRQRRLADNSADDFTPFVPICGEADDDDEEPSSAADDGDTDVSGAFVPPTATWLGYSSKLFGGFFNLTISGSSVRPFGRCVAASSKFNLIEYNGNEAMTSGGQDDRCYRCMFVDRRSPVVVQMRTTPLQCLTLSSNVANTDTLYRICASLSPSLPLLTLLKINENSSTTCPFEVGNYRVSYEMSVNNQSPGTLDVSSLLHSGCGPDDGAGRSRACVDRSGIHLYLASSPGCEPQSGQLRGSLSIQCLASWSQQQSENDHHMFAFVRLSSGDNSNNTPSIRCAVYHHTASERRHPGFSLAIGSGFDCSDLSSVSLKSPTDNKHPHQHHKQHPGASHAHIFHFISVVPETPSTSPVTTTASGVSSSSTPSTGVPLTDSKHRQENAAVSACSMPNFVLAAKSWHSVDSSTFQLMPTTASTFTFFINRDDDDDDRIALYLTCIEPEIWDRSPTASSPTSRIYQAVYGVLLNPSASFTVSKRSANIKTAEDAGPSSHSNAKTTGEFVCSDYYNSAAVNNVTAAPAVVEPGTAKRAQRQQPSVNSHGSKRKNKHPLPTYRCVKFYQRDRHVVELVLGSATHGPTAVVCADLTKEEHRVTLIDSAVFMGYSSTECLSIPSLPEYLVAPAPNLPVVKPAPVEDVIGRGCLVRLCNAISSAKNRDEQLQWEAPNYLVFRKGSSCSSDDQELSLFFTLRKCAYRWRRDYVSDNLLFSPIIKRDAEAMSPLSCFILQHNGISSTISRLVPNANCWFDSQSFNLTANISSTVGAPTEFDEFFGFNFDANEACNSPTQEPTFVNSNNAGSISSRETLIPMDDDPVLRSDGYYETSPKFWRRLTSSKNSAHRRTPPLLLSSLSTIISIIIIIISAAFSLSSFLIVDTATTVTS